MARGETHESIFRLRADLISARVLVWAARAGRDADLTPEAHLYFSDRYRRLAAFHRARSHDARARRLQAKGDEHDRLGGGGDPPYAAAMAMPRPARWLATDAIARRPAGPGDAA